MTYMLLSELKQKFKPVYGGDSWDETIVTLMSEPLEREIIDFLLDDLKKNTYFREAVYIGSDEDEDTGLITHKVFDGTHRMCAYLISGAEFAYVLHEDEEWSEETSDGSYLETKISGPWVEGDDEKEFALWETIRSLRITDEVWLTSGVSSSTITDGHLELAVYWDNGGQKSFDDINLVNDVIIEKLKKYGYEKELGFLSIKTLLNVEDVE